MIRNLGSPENVQLAAEMNRQGCDCVQKGDYHKASDLFRKAALFGHAEAMIRVAWLFYDGKGVPQDARQAMFWFKQAVDCGSNEAKMALKWVKRQVSGASPKTTQQHDQEHVGDPVLLQGIQKTETVASGILDCNSNEGSSLELADEKSTIASSSSSSTNCAHVSSSSSSTEPAKTGATSSESEEVAEETEQTLKFLEECEQFVSQVDNTLQKTLNMVSDTVSQCSDMELVSSLCKLSIAMETYKSQAESSSSSTKNCGSTSSSSSSASVTEDVKLNTRGIALVKARKMDEALKLFHKAAEGKNAHAMNNEGVLISGLPFSVSLQSETLELSHSNALYDTVFTGIRDTVYPGAQDTPRDASSLFKAAAKLNCGSACYNLGALVLRKRSTSQNAMYGVQVFMNLAHHYGSVAAIRYFANTANTSNDQEQVVQYLQQAADRNDIPSLILLAQRYVKKDCKKAFECYEKAASLGSSEAMFCMGKMLRDGSMGKIDPKGSLTWILKAAELGHSAARQRAISIYTTGDGPIKKDPKKARFWKQKNHKQ
jgi:TPR repeat protein